MKKIEIIIGVIFCIMAILSAIVVSLICSLHYDLSVINKQYAKILFLDDVDEMLKEVLGEKKD